MVAEAEKKAEEAFARAKEESAQEEESEWDTSEFESWTAEDGMKVYNCPSCSAELICDETTAATSCPYCGNHTVIPGQLSGGLKPNYIIPFKLDKKAAKECLKRYYKGKRLLPKGFDSDNRLEEIKGIYVPFWLFDGEADAFASFHATNTHVYRSGDYQISETHHYNVRRAGKVPFVRIPVDGSKKMPDNHMDSIEPFDYSELREFSTAYLPGFLADKYDVTAEESAARADMRASNTALRVLRGDVHGYGTCVMRDSNVKLHRSKVHYGLLPVYMLNTAWKGKNYLFAVNGQSGKLVGDLPIDMGKFWKWFFGITAAITAVLGTFLFLVL